ncbi:MAG: hypothetical protein ACKVOM_03345 [Ferruginibacter sp.]
MARKKWTAKEDVTEVDIKFREKRKWQQALRRYVLDKNPSESYAMYFGLSIGSFREWIELQFNGDLNWDNFATAWQFDHIVPIAYFDFGEEADLKLAWNFINIRVEKYEIDKVKRNRIDAIAVKTYFQQLYEKTNYSLCARMLEKIIAIEESNVVSEPNLEHFIKDKKKELELTATLNKYEFAELNKGVTLSDILLEREILKKFG